MEIKKCCLDCKHKSGFNVDPASPLIKDIKLFLETGKPPQDYFICDWWPFDEKRQFQKNGPLWGQWDVPIFTANQHANIIAKNHPYINCPAWELEEKES